LESARAFDDAKRSIREMNMLIPFLRPPVRVRLAFLSSATFGLVTATLLAGSTPAAAQQVQGPWCAYYASGGVDCSQPSREMCRLSVQYRPSVGRCYPNENYHRTDAPGRRTNKRRIDYGY
jgi:hypothetical protein